MNLEQSLDACFENFGSTSGRASKSEFWWLMMVIFLAVGVPFNISIIMGALADGMVNVFSLFLLISFVVPFAGAIPLICVGIRRLHDSGKSSNFMYLSLFPFIGPIILLAMMTDDGEPRDNKYGYMTQDAELAEKWDVNSSVSELNSAMSVLAIMNVIVTVPLLLIGWVSLTEYGLINPIIFKIIILELPCVVSLLFARNIHKQMKEEEWLTKSNFKSSIKNIYIFIGIAAVECVSSSFFIFIGE